MKQGKLNLLRTLRKCIEMLFAKQKIKTSLLVFIIISTALIPSINSIFLQNITDTIESYSNEDLSKINLTAEMFKWILIYAFWWEAINIIWRIYDYAYMKIMPTIKAQVVDEFFYYIQYHEHRFFQSNLAGDITNKITEASRSLEMIFAEANEKIIKKLFTLIFAFFTLYSVHSTIGSIFLIWMITFISTSLYFADRLNDYSTLYGLDKALIAGKIVDAISNISTIRLFNSHNNERKYLSKYLDRAIKSDQNMQWFMFKLRYALGISCTIMMGCIVYYIIHLRGNLEISVGQCILIITLCIAVIDDVWDLTQSFGDLFEQIGCFNQVICLLDKYKILDAKNAKDLVIKKPTIEFKNATFKYRNNNKFDNQSIFIHHHQRIGLIGFSGSGKTTFCALISRLYDLDGGSILIDGQDIKNVSQKTLRDNISVIPQEPILFHRSIKENIKYGNPESTDNDVIKAAKLSHIHDFIMSLKDGYDTICGERGNNFSGGQRQRIIIARAFLKNAPILILDEATSSLDSHTEQLIQKSLQNLMINKTVLVIAHRLSTLLHMDRILVFNKGHVVEDGPHSNLQKHGKLYKMLWEHF